MLNLTQKILDFTTKTNHSSSRFAVRRGGDYEVLRTANPRVVVSFQAGGVVVASVPMTSHLGFLIDDLYWLHDPGSRHPESPRRLTAIREALEEFGAFERWQRVAARPAHIDELALVHKQRLIEQVEKACQRAPAYLDPDTPVSRESYRAALFAAGGVLECIDVICTGQLKRAFAFVRPPGHHALPDKAMGFCLFNNVALAAAHVRLKHKLDRVAVVDFDIHHGNGTQACFYDDPQVLFVSSHQYPFFPGSGDFGEVGVKSGAGYTLNFPLSAGTGDGVFVPIYSRIVAAVLDHYRPQLILVSAGFDAHFLDPLGQLDVTTEGYASVAASLILAADSCCEGKICFVLEGGYSMEALQKCTTVLMAAMESEHPRELPVPDGPLFGRLSDQARRSFGHFWKW